ncbi:MAG: YafY family protein [Gammaproteobacteria bacterium]|nr:YafY family protein [Gammaproteobacteria bacterium]
MSNPTTRVLTVLELLQTHGRISGTELARRLNVDVRTVRRYIGALEELGIPVTAEQGRYGGYYLVAGFKLPPMMFTNEETLAIALGLLAAHSLGLAEAAPAIESVQAKLERVMPGRLRQQIRALGETTVLDLPGANPVGNMQILAELSTAAREQQRVVIRYQAPENPGQFTDTPNHSIAVEARAHNKNTPTQREFDPYGLVFRYGNWYAAGYCHLRKSLRTFRLDRILSLRSLDTHFQRPADFNAADHLSLSIATMGRGIPVVVKLHTDLDTAMKSMVDELGLLVPQEEGLQLHSSTNCLQWFARMLARLPFRFTIEQPDALREELQKHAEQLLQAC